MTWAPDEEQLRRALAAEYGMITLIDESIGRILDAVDRLGLGERTTTVFTADHGDLFGDHGLMLKHFVHYDGVLRIPLAVRAPGGAAGRVRSLTSSADLAPTLLDLAGVAPYRGIQGLSLRPLLDGRAATLRSGLLVEEDQPFGVDGLPGPVRMRTLVTEDARLTLYADRPFGELYDRTSDPGEVVNLFDRPEGAALRGRLTEHLARELMDVADTGVRPAAAA
jgi:arylsulfatase A-like enzyme